jgi:sporulation protein YlmC with PRC-barrel domain
MTPANQGPEHGSVDPSNHDARHDSSRDRAQRDGALENRLTGAIDGVLHLLDRQLLDCDGEFLGKVDDVELTPDQLTGRLVITALLTGPAALLDRFGGRLGRVLVERWGQMRVSEPNRTRPWRIDIGDVARLDSAVHLSVHRDGVLRRDREAYRFGRLTGMDVIGPDGNRLGRVLDARFERDPAGRLSLASLVVGHGRPGSLLGYDRRGERGPWLVKTLVLWLHRHSAIVGAGHADINWDAHEVRLGRRPEQPTGHPFDETPHD